MNLNDSDMLDTSDIAEGGLNNNITVPLGVGGFEGDVGGGEFAGSSRKLKSGSLLLGAVVVLAVGGLFLMKTLASASASFVGSPAIEQIIESFLNPDGDDTLNLMLGDDQAQVLEVLNETYTERQVPLVNVQKNPFILQEVPVQHVQDTNPDAELIRWEKDRERQRIRFQTAGGRFNLKSVMLGSTPLANISGKIVRIGETIVAMPEEVSFRVTVIEDNLVELVATDDEFELEVPVTLSIKR